MPDASPLTLDSVSVLLVWTAIAIYALAFIAYAVDLARRGAVAAEAKDVAVRERELVAASGGAGVSRTGIIEQMRADGSVHSIFLTLLPQFAEDGALSHLVAMLDRVSDESDTEAVGRMPLSSIIDVLPGTFYVLRDDGSFALWNKTLEEVTSMSADEVAHANALDMYDLAEKRITVDWQPDY